MHITIQCDIDAGVSQNLAQTLCIEARFYAFCRERVPEGMKIRVRNTASGKHRLETVLHCPRFDGFLRFARKQERARLICVAKIFAEPIRQRNFAHRTLALWGRGDDFRFRAIPDANTLHRLGYAHFLLMQRNIIPTQRAKLPNAYAREKAK